MKLPHRVHLRGRLSLEALEPRLPPGTILFGSSLSLTGFDLDLPTGAEALATQQLQGGVAGAKSSSKPRFSTSKDDDLGNLRMAGGDVNRFGDKAEPIADVFLPAQETVASYRPGALEGVSQVAWSAG